MAEISSDNPDRSAQTEDLNELFPKVYDELKRLALMQMAPERGDHTLTPTALLHEAYLRVAIGQASAKPMSRIHFFALAAEAMRRILVEHARKHGRRQKVLRDRILPDLSGKQLVIGENTDLVELDSALTKLAGEHPQNAKLVQVRFFGGLTMAEAAEVLDVSLATANRQWAFARAWLARELMVE